MRWNYTVAHLALTLITISLVGISVAIAFDFVGVVGWIGLGIATATNQFYHRRSIMKQMTLDVLAQIERNAAAQASQHETRH